MSCAGLQLGLLASCSCGRMVGLDWISWEAIDIFAAYVVWCSVSLRFVVQTLVRSLMTDNLSLYLWHFAGKGERLIIKF